MKTTSLIKYGIIGACLPLFMGCVERQVVYRDRPAPPPPVVEAPPPVVVTEDEAPPPPAVQVEVAPPMPGPPSIWFYAPGTWEWHGRWGLEPRSLDGPASSRRGVGGLPIGTGAGGHRVWVEGSWR